HARAGGGLVPRFRCGRRRPRVVRIARRRAPRRVQGVGVLRQRDLREVALVADGVDERLGLLLLLQERQQEKKAKAFINPIRNESDFTQIPLAKNPDALDTPRGTAPGDPNDPRTTTAAPETRDQPPAGPGV